MTALPVDDSSGGELERALLVREAHTGWALAIRTPKVWFGGGVLALIVLTCLFSLVWTLSESEKGKGVAVYADQGNMPRIGPQWTKDDRVSAVGWFGYDHLGRSIFARCLLGGTISLAVGLAAATISVVLGVAVGLVAGYRGGWVDAVLMRAVDVLYGLPYVLLVILFKVAFQDPLVTGVSGRVVWELIMFGVGTIGMMVALTRLHGWAAAMVAIALGLGALDGMLNLGTWRETVWYAGMTELPSWASRAVGFRVGIEALVLAWALAAMFVAIMRLRGPAQIWSAVAVGVVALAALLNMTLWKTQLWTPILKVEAPKVAVKLESQTASVVVMFLAIGLVSWLTMARVVRGQVMSLRGQPFIESCRALGMKEMRIFLRHILPNLIGPITVYATLTVPAAILQESFLSFLGVGVNPPLATWGSLASEGVEQLSPLKFYWWMLIFPCGLLAVTLLSLNFMGDGLRDVFDPKKEAAKI